MGYVYIVIAVGYNRVRIGYSTERIERLKNRCVKLFGTDLEFLMFEHGNACEIDALFKMEFQKYRLHDELYEREHVHEYIAFMEDRSNRV